jgi:hypothetical protein
MLPMLGRAKRLERTRGRTDTFCKPITSRVGFSVGRICDLRDGLYLIPSTGSGVRAIAALRGHIGFE